METHSTNLGLVQPFDESEAGYRDSPSIFDRRPCIPARLSGLSAIVESPDLENVQSFGHSLPVKNRGSWCFSKIYEPLFKNVARDRNQMKQQGLHMNRCAPPIETTQDFPCDAESKSKDRCNSSSHSSGLIVLVARMGP